MFLRGFHEACRFVKAINDTFQTRIPKIGGAKDLRNFRLLSVEDSLNKLLSRGVGNRLKKTMGKVIMEFQNDFLWRVSKF